MPPSQKQPKRWIQPGLFGDQQVMGADPDDRPAPSGVLIGMVGFAGSGKDEFARQLAASHGAVAFGLGDLVRDLAERLDPLLPDGRDIHRLSVLLHCYGGWDTLKRAVPSVREFLQNLGQSAKLVFGDDCWVRQVERLTDEALAAGKVVVHTSVRYPVEVAAVRSRGGVLVNVRRPGVGAVNDHDSERLAAELAERPGDAVVVWNDGTVEDLGRKAALVVQDIIAGRAGSAPAA